MSKVTNETKDVNIKLGTFTFAGFISVDTMVIYINPELTLWKNNVCIKRVSFSGIYVNTYILRINCCFDKFIAIYSPIESNIFIYDKELNLLCKLRFESNIGTVGWSKNGKLAISLHNGKIEIWELKNNELCYIGSGVHFPQTDTIRGIVWSPIEFLAIYVSDYVLIWNNDFKYIQTYYFRRYPLPIWIGDTELSFIANNNSGAVFDTNTNKQIWHIDKFDDWVATIPVTNEIILCLVGSELILVIRNGENTDYIIIKKFDMYIYDMIWSPKGNLVVTTNHNIFTCNIPEISLLKLIPLGLSVEKTIWSDFLKNEPYDFRLFLFIAALTCNKK